MVGSVARHFVIPPLLAIATVVIATGASAAASVRGAAWAVSLVAQPTNLPLSAHHVGEPEDQYVIMLTNTGSMASSEGERVVITDQLPAGVTVEGEFEGQGWECPTAHGSSLVTCFYSGVVPALGRSQPLVIPVADSATGVLVNHVTVSGGGAPSIVATRATEAGGSLPDFGFVDFSNQTSDTSGLPDRQAGDHSYAITTILDFPQGRGEGPIQIPKAMEVDLPAGLTGNPLAASQCTIVAVFSQTCPASSRVGTFAINFGKGLFGHLIEMPIYNVVPEHGYPAEFALYAEELNRPAFMYATLRTGSDYGVHLSVPDIPPAAAATNLAVTFFGDPSVMDGGGNPPVPLLTNPGDCSSVPLVTAIRVDTWEEPERWVGALATAVPVSGCNLLRFQPSLTVSPDNTTADEPSGYRADVQLQSQSQDLAGLATPDLKNATVTLPQGVSVSPSAADGLVACQAEGAEGINLDAPGAGHCPLSARVGTVEATTPLLANPLEGHVYVAQPGCGGSGQSPCTDADALNGTLYGLYLELEGSGVTIKLHGAVSANPATGQLTATFRETPQQPVSDLIITMMAGPRAPLANPQTCGEALTTSDMVPWSSPETPDAAPSSAFIVNGCEGSPFTPSFLAGTASSGGGAYTDFSTSFGRTDRQQDLGAIQVQTPSGLLGMLSHVTLCGESQATQGACPGSSRIGTATTATGPGSHPLWVSGPVYLTGPYRGAPFGLSVAIPAVAGPFNLGTVVVRAAINADPHTAQLTITSDPLPQILDGVPLRVQAVRVTVDKSQFMFNPTNCEAKQINATIISAQGATAKASTPFAAGGCKNLPFVPKFTVSTQGASSKKNGASLDVKVTSAGLGQANIAKVFVSLPKQLPARLTTLQQACPEATFAANPATCPIGSNVGVATAVTPILSEPLTGPAYLVSHGGAAFPDLVVILQGQGVRLDLIGNTNITKSITTSSFAAVPDAPISSFELKLPQGPHSALTSNLPGAARGNLCGSKLLMPTTITGQNYAIIKQSTKIAVTGCPKVRARKAKVRARKASARTHHSARPTRGRKAAP